VLRIQQIATRFFDTIERMPLANAGCRKPPQVFVVRLQACFKEFTSWAGGVSLGVRSIGVPASSTSALTVTQPRTRRLRHRSRGADRDRSRGADRDRSRGADRDRSRMLIVTLAPPSAAPDAPQRPRLHSARRQRWPGRTDNPIATLESRWLARRASAWITLPPSGTQAPRVSSSSYFRICTASRASENRKLRDLRRARRSTVAGGANSRRVVYWSVDASVAA
jgi:hypothetical protein